ncbi:TadE/TadG family type IV pilus assembly protein [Halodesulfovibrio marinisediminis]|uniref:TadE-like protein n=1 Tax=Halodesulfovibrio marinisediminis DSM 17456 TaxID=1121457 RepID=A0A1N6EAB7_9BACT|nr:TadE/TadG family type IV pilus assembly protein [Halodesulfovibrio marinisediminis]SIN79964.1 TadE-like protein [Halodesulfovibrio marinisediminis DSM 17456]
MLSSRRQFCSERGAAAIEMALMLPILLLLVFGTIEIGRFYWAKHAVVHAANEGARLAVLPDVTQQEIDEVVAFYLSDWDPTVVPTVTPIPATANAPAAIKVTVSIPFSFIILPNFITGAFGVQAISHSVTMRSEK